MKMSNCQPLTTAAAGRRSGFTLVELSVVIAIVVVMAGLALLRAGSFEDRAKRQVTYASMAAIRAAISGPPEKPGYFEDVGQLPPTIAGLLVVPVNIPPSKAVFDPATGFGWHGPYFQYATGTYKITDPPGSDHFTAQYGNTNDPAILDAWTLPIVLQIPLTAGPAGESPAAYARLVSAGPDGVLDTPAGWPAPDINNTAVVRDDVVLYLFRANGP
jgi:prepilin-type N-terminal cleavage/methylation domain-containing protein